MRLPSRTAEPRRLAIGLAIRLERQKQGLTQKELAARCGLYPGYVCRLERNNVEPQILTFSNVALALKRRPSELLRAAEDGAI